MNTLIQDVDRYSAIDAGRIASTLANQVEANLRYRIARRGNDCILAAAIESAAAHNNWELTEKET